MVSNHRILFPIDFSNYPFTVPPAIGALIDRPNTEVILLHVIDAGRSPGSQLAHGIQKLDALAQRHFGHSVVRRRMDNGSPAIRILDYIRDHEVDMVVMPARDSGGFGKGALGRVAGEVLAKAACPVWLEWRSAAERRATPTASPRISGARICCTLEGAGPAEQTLRDAVAIAERLHGELTVISSVQPQPGDCFALLRDPILSERAVLRETERIDRLRRGIAPFAEVMVGVGWMEGVIGRALRDRNADLLIAGDCRQAILAAESICPVLRVAPHPGDVSGFRGRVPAQLPEYRRVA